MALQFIAATTNRVKKPKARSSSRQAYIWAVQKFDRDAFVECTSGTPGLDKTGTMDDMTRYYTTEMSRACYASMPRRRQHKNQRPAFWWNTEILALRNSSSESAEKKKSRKRRERGYTRTPESYSETSSSKAIDNAGKFCASMSRETHGARSIA